MLKVIGLKNKVSAAASKSKVHPFELRKKTTAAIKTKSKKHSHKESAEDNTIPSKYKQFMELFNEVSPSKANDNDTSLVAGRRNWRAPLKQKDHVIFVASRTYMRIEPTSPDNIDYALLSQCKIDSGMKENQGDHNGKHGAAPRKKEQSSAVRNKHISKTKNLSNRTNKSEYESVPPHSTFIHQIKEKNKKLQAKMPTEPCKVTAKKGTLTHLKQRQMRQDYLLQQQREEEAFDDFFDDTDNPEIANFHKAKYQIPDLYLDSSATSGSTTFNNSNISSCSVPQTPPTTEKGEKTNRKKQNVNGHTSTASSNSKKGSFRDKTDSGYASDSKAFSPRSLLLARFAGDESDGRGLLVKTPPTTSEKGIELGVNLGLAMTPGELLEQNVANRIIYNNKIKRSRKRLVFPNPTPFNHPPLVGSSRYRVINQSGACHLRMSFSSGSLSQSPDTSLRKQAGRLSEVPVEYESWPDAAVKKTMRLKLPSILDDLASQEEEGSDHDEYFENGDK